MLRNKGTERPGALLLLPLAQSLAPPPLPLLTRGCRLPPSSLPPPGTGEYNKFYPEGGNFVWWVLGRWAGPGAGLARGAAGRRRRRAPTPAAPDRTDLG